MTNEQPCGWGCGGCPVCDPDLSAAPSPSTVDEARRDLIHHFTGNPDDEFDGNDEVVDALVAAVKREEQPDDSTPSWQELYRRSSAALADAKAYASGLEMACDALRADGVSSRTMFRAERTRAEQAEARVQGLEAVETAAWAALEYVGNHYSDTPQHLEAVDARRNLRAALAAVTGTRKRASDED